MAIVTGPLHSISASGQLGKALIYQPTNGRSIVRAYGKPNWTSHPATAPQLAVQALTKQLMEHWPEIDAGVQATWDALAVPARISRLNAYLRENYRRIHVGQDATDVWPAVETPPTALTVVQSGESLEWDCLGDYQAIEDINGELAFKRIAEPDCWVYWLPDPQGTYVVSSDLDWEMGTTWFSNVGDLEGTYNYQSEDQLIVSLYP